MLGSLLPQVEAVKSSVGGPSRALGLCLVGLLSVILVPVVQAQERPLPPGLAAGQLERPQVQPACFLHSMPGNTGDAQSATVSRHVVLFANCSGTGILLGEADSYSLSYNPASGALAVSVNFGDSLRVMLLQRDTDGATSVEDITGDLAVAAGRNPTSGLRGTRIDFTAFGSEGVIGIGEDVRAVREASPSARGVASFSLNEHNEKRRGAAQVRDASGTGGVQ